MEGEDITFTIQIFPHRNFLRVLEKADLTCQVYFADGYSSKDIPVPKTAKDNVTFKFPSPDNGEPDRIIIRQENTNVTWLLDCVTGRINSKF